MSTSTRFILPTMTTFTADGEQALNAFIESFKNKDIPSFIVGVTNVENEIYFKGCGSSVIRDPASKEINPDSVHWMCSSTKLIIALAALKLIEQGKLSFETNAEDFLPELRNPVIVDTDSQGKSVVTPAKTAITVNHLLNHSSGLFYPFVPETPYALPALFVNKEVHRAQANSVSKFLQLLRGDYPGIPLKFEPGTDFAYGWSTDILGFIIAKASGVSLESFCKENILNPLGMTSTSFYLTPDLRERLVDLTFSNGDGQYHPWANQFEILEQDPEKLRLHLGGGGMYSSMRDYLTLLRHILQINSGVKTSVDPIWTQDTIRKLFVPTLTEKGTQSLAAMGLSEYGTQWGNAMAINTVNKAKGRKKGSASWAGWAGTSQFIDPTTGIAVVFGAQVTPPANPGVWPTLEELIYSGINSTAD